MSAVTDRPAQLSARSNATPARRKRIGRVRAVLALFTVVGFGTVATLAAFSDSGTQLSTFSAGNIDLKFDGATGDNPTGLSTLTLSNTKPGTAVYKSIVVNNIGSLGITYNLAATTSTTSSTDLATGLVLSVYTGVTAANCATGTTSAGTAVINAQPLNAVTGFASPRTLAATSGTDTLCFAVSLPSTAGNNLQSMNTSASFIFTGSPA